MSRNYRRRKRHTGVPQDYKPARGTVILDGHPIYVNEDALDDYELLESYEQLEAQNPAATIRIVKLIFNDDTEYEKVKKLAQVDGRVSIRKMSDFLASAMEQMSPNF
ncbi:hypothetical protein [Alloscardovia macacae]|uniref:Uncharacterized protein n=1 Tax=Alloscardovia macacae TaxID=1160091 RepID=A0A261F1W5_9BIFI|nr:hypothetical protein [Alloscardovia macacae]OZG53104.1 hypothetical protein ALMA_1406 [Alloscardovia macacae]